MLVREIILSTLILALSPSILSQPVKPLTNRAKEFGESLKRFDRQPSDTSRRTNSASDDEVIRIETNFVINDALVIDRSGSIVVGLQKSDFIVNEDGTPQTIELFSSGNDVRTPKSIVLIVDNGGTPSVFLRNLRAATHLVQRLSSNDRMAIASDDIKLLCDFTDDKEKLLGTLRLLARKPGASRHEYSTLMAVLNELFVGSELRPIVLIQGSGDEILSMKPIWPTTLAICKKGFKDWCERSFSVRDILNSVERSRATIYGVVPEPRLAGLDLQTQKKKVATILDGFSDEIHNRRNAKEKTKFRSTWEELTIRETVATQQSMMDITRLSGGFTTFLESAENVDSLYQSLFATIENRYTLGYQSDRLGTGVRSIGIAVKGHPEYSVVGRRSYTPYSAK
ncbi:MAG: hypothetical protein WBO10_03475 [Pyrinomonadaceae bacterium]